MSAIDLDRYDTDKPPGYLSNYEREFVDLFDQPISLLELGIQRGGSMLLWRDLFPHGQIAGLDLNSVPVDDTSGRVRTYVGFQQDPNVLDRIAAEVAPDGFDIIVDDASHLGRYTAESFWHLFPRHLKPGGIYVLDDWSCGYAREWADGHEFAGDRSTIEPQFGTAGPTVGSGRLEALRRQIRGAARPIAAKLADRPELSRRLERLYMQIEGMTVQTRFPSHDYGMVGFVKQLVDACAIDVIDAPPGRGSSPQPHALIESVRVTPSQVFVRKV